MNSKGISFVLSMYKTDSVKVINEFIDNLPFKPLKMRPALLHKKVKYNKTDYVKAFEKALIENSRCSAKIYNDYSNAICFRYDDISGVITLIFHTTNCKNEDELALLFEKIITRNRIISAYFRDKLDNSLSSQSQISFYESLGIDTSNLKIIQDKMFKTNIIDIEQFSGHSHEYGGIEFTSTYIMWFGNDFFKFVPQETLTSFKKCISNETLENGTIRIQLYENINDYNSEEADRNQWAFRRHTNIDKVAEDWHLKYCKTPPGDLSGANMIIEHGNFEHGGVKLVKAYYDENNKSTPKKKAFKVVLTEYNSSNNVVFQSEEIL
jgi:hypothetical protein